MMTVEDLRRMIQNLPGAIPVVVCERSPIYDPDIEGIPVTDASWEGGLIYTGKERPRLILMVDEPLDLSEAVDDNETLATVER